VVSQPDANTAPPINTQDATRFVKNFIKVS
jgi:hypothetical protein